MIERLLTYMKDEPARFRAAILLVVIGVADQVDDFLDFIGLDESEVLGVSLDDVVAAEPAIDKGLTIAFVLILVAFGRTSIRELVTPLSKIEERSATAPVWREDGGE